MRLAIGDRVRYRPGIGTYGYEDAVGADGRVPGVVLGFSRTRVRLELTLDLGRKIQRSVDVCSVEREAKDF